MRNLKRALSLALASVMLLGMMVVGSSAAFADADEIVNTKAVEVTAGLGLFAGSDGKFNPKGNVTRAQMATVIVKMLYGSEINADQFKGSGKFSDTAAFEGGWAEGYINLCAEKGIVGGYGDGTFKPGQAVTTAEAVTMIINALGVDAGEGTWPLTVMAKAEEMALFEEIEGAKPGTNVALTRDQLAAIVLEGIEYSPAGKTGYTVEGITDAKGKLIVFTEMDKAVAAAIEIAPVEGDKPVLSGLINEVTGDDALIKTVFAMAETQKAFIVGNQATGEDCTILSNGLWLDLETGLDMIGHCVEAYYSEKYTSEKDPGVAYCVVEAAEYVAVAEAIDTKKEYTPVFGTSKLLTVAGDAMYINGNYVEDDETVPYVEDDYDVAVGTYVINEDDIIIGYIAPATVYAGVVDTIGTRAGNEYIFVDKKWSNTEDVDYVIEYDGIAEEDIVTYVVIGEGDDAIAVLTKATAVEGQITKTFTKDEKNYITVNGTNYAQNTAITVNAGLETDKDVAKVGTTTYTVYLDANGKWFGFEGAKAAANLNEVVYVVGTYVKEATSGYSDEITIKTTYAQVIDMEGKESQIVIAIDDNGSDNDYELPEDGDAALSAEDLEVAGFYTFEKATGKAGKAGVMVGTKIDTAKNEKGDNIYSGAIAGGTELKSTETYYENKNILEGDNVAFLTADTKFIVVEGEPGSALTTAISTGTITKKLVKGDPEVGVDAPMILSTDANGNAIIEVVIIPSDDLKVSSENLFYVTADQIAVREVVGDGKFQFEVYVVADGTTKTIVAEDDVDLAGFYSFELDTAENLYSLEEEAADKTGVTFTGLMNGNIVRFSGEAAGLKAENAYVVDTRTEESLKADDAACDFAIETLAEMQTVSKDNTITMDLILDEEGKNILAIYILSVVEKEEA